MSKKTQFPDDIVPDGCVILPCPDPDCDGTATRFVLQHRHQENGEVYAVATWETPAYVSEAGKKPHKWQCPACGKKDHDIEAVLVRCGKCTRFAKAPQLQEE